MKTHFRTVLVVVASVLIIVSCGGGGGGSTIPAPIPEHSNVLVSSIFVNVITIDSSESQQIEADVSPENAENQTLSWAVDDEDVASIDDSGVLTPVWKM